MNRIESHFQEALKVLAAFAADKEQMENIQRAAHAMIESLQNGGKILSCGNGEIGRAHV